MRWNRQNLQVFRGIGQGLIEIRWKNQVFVRQTEEHARSVKRASFIWKNAQAEGYWFWPEMRKELSARIMDDDYFEDYSSTRRKEIILKQKILEFQKQHNIDQISTSKEVFIVESDVKLPVLVKGEFESWKISFLDLIDKHESGKYIILSLQEGRMKNPTKFYYYPGAYGLKEKGECVLPLEELSDEQRKRFEADKLAKLENKSKLSLNEEVKILESKNSELKRKIYDFENQIVQLHQATSVESFEEKIKNLEDANAELQKKKFSEFSRKSSDEKKAVELKCIKLSQQISDFVKVIMLEREKFAKEKKAIEQKNKLTAKLSELSECALKDQKAKSEFHEKIDLLTEEKNSYFSEIKELEDIVSNVVVTEHTTSESQIHTPRNNSADFKETVSSSHQKTVSTRRTVNSFDQIRTTNIFYYQNVDGSGEQRRRRRYKEEELVWKVKPVEEEKKDNHVYSRDHLIRGSKDQNGQRHFLEKVLMISMLKSSKRGRWYQEMLKLGENVQELIVKESLLKEFKDFRIVEDNLLKRSEFLSDRGLVTTFGREC
ncbi:hypothetical protein L6452_42014 [Arctium lappa]|uniref:Uncharacterized protein n=1 Tax=Arctium lappa TaxID=4217 RepID=A0ACB8XGK7_ARCLA|nr:hypothetical protein L6452_42014 [Arctium lappa]